MIPVAEAEALILASLSRYPSVTLPIAKCTGRVLRAPVLADRAQPPFDRVALDGIAIAHAAWEKGVRAFPIEGRQKAGEPPKRLKAEGGCLEVMTGAVLPVGTDLVVPVEDLEISGKTARLRDPERPRGPWQNVHRAGSDCAAGEEIVPAGVRLAAPHLAAAAAFGLTSLPVAYSPSVAVVATGDELVDPARVPAVHQIRRSNPFAIQAALQELGIGRVALLHCRDERGRLRRTLEGVLGKCDVLVLTGGVSMGQADFVPEVLADLGVKPVFHKVRQKPGKPFWFGLAPERPAPAGTARAPEPIPVFALPGNPAAVLVCLYRYVLPALRAAQGAAPEPSRVARLAEGAPATGAFTLFRPVRTRLAEDGAVEAAFAATQGSGDFSGWARCDGFVELPAESGPLSAGTLVRYVPWRAGFP